MVVAGVMGAASGKLVGRSSLNGYLQDVRVPDKGILQAAAVAVWGRCLRERRARGCGDGAQPRPVRHVGAQGNGHHRRVQDQLRERGRLGHGLRQGRVQPQGLQRHGRLQGVRRRRVRRLRFHRRRQLPRHDQGREGGGGARRQERQRVPGRERLRDAGQPGAHRDQHHGRDGVRDHAGLRDHGPLFAGCAAQVGWLRPGCHHDAGDQRPRAVHDPAARVRGLHWLRHYGPRLGVLRRPGAAPLDDPGCPGRRHAGAGEPARGHLQPQELPGDGRYGLGAIHGRAGVLDGSARHPALALARGLRVLRHPPRPEQRRRAATRVDVQPASGAAAVRGHRGGDGRGHAQHEHLPGGRRRDRGGHPARQGLRLPGELVPVVRVPEDADGQGLVRGQDHIGDRVRRRGAAEDGRAHDGRPLHAWQPARPHGRGGQGGPARLHVRRDGREDEQRLPAEHLGRSPRRWAARPSRPASERPGPN